MTCRAPVVQHDAQRLEVEKTLQMTGKILEQVGESPACRHGGGEGEEPPVGMPLPIGAWPRGCSHVLTLHGWWLGHRRTETPVWSGHRLSQTGISWAVSAPSR